MNNGRSPQEEPGTYLDYLPAIYADDPFLGRFLRLFEDVLSPIQAVVNTLPERFDPRLAPPSMLERLASWVGAQRPPRLPERSWRQLVLQTVWLHRWRGTRRGLSSALELATGKRPLITEYSQGLVLGSDAALGLNTRLEMGRPLHVDVMFPCCPEDIDKSLVETIIRGCKPAYISHGVRFGPLRA